MSRANECGAFIKPINLLLGLLLSFSSENADRGCRIHARDCTLAFCTNQNENTTDDKKIEEHQVFTCTHTRIPEECADTHTRKTLIRGLIRAST